MAKRKTTADDAPTEIIRANVNRENVQADNFLSFYANDTQIQVSPWDVRFIFGVIDEPPTQERPTVRIKSVAEARMSPQHAKKVAEILIRQIVSYEQNIGPIPVPD
ncbi:MAG: DUF3467 domain-containing protein [Vicinamibacterales bacterium]